MQNQIQNLNQNLDSEQNQNQPPKKELFSFISVKTLLAVLIFTVLTVIIIGGWIYVIGGCSKNEADKITKSVNQETENYYDVLEKKCDGDSCCLSSLKRMRANNYKEADENGKCPDGFYMDMLKCVTSYQCCVPIKEKNCAKIGEFVNPNNLKGKTNYPDVCCDGLKGVNAYKVNEDGECEAIIGTPYLTCVPCGNGVCDEIDLWFENKCNCPEDCGNKIDTSDWQTYRNEEYGFEMKYLEKYRIYDYADRIINRSLTVKEYNNPIANFTKEGQHDITAHIEYWETREGYLSFHGSEPDFIIEVNKNGYIVIDYSPGVNYPVPFELKKEWETILSTFKFID